MKHLIILLMSVISLNTFGKSPCSPEIQNKIDSILLVIAREDNQMKRIDLEFEIKQITYNFTQCRLDGNPRGLSSLELPEIDIVATETQEKDDSGLDEVLARR